MAGSTDKTLKLYDGYSHDLAQRPRPRGRGRRHRRLDRGARPGLTRWQTRPTGSLDVDALLAAHVDALGGDFAGYRNHVRRVAEFCADLAPEPPGPRDST